MPLPHRGVGETLTGGSPGGRAGAGAHQETLFGIAPEHLFGDLAGRQAPDLQRPATPATPGATEKPARPAPAAPRTMFGVPAAPGERAGSSAAPAAAAPFRADAPPPNRTLVGVVADDLRVVARHPAPSPPPEPRSPAAGPTEEPARRGGGTALAWEHARGSTVVGATAAPNPAPRRPSPPPLRPGPSPQRTVLEPQGPFGSPRGETGTVRSISAEPPPPKLAAHGGPSPDLHRDGEDASPAEPGLPLHARTALGVAIPGIAPLRAGAKSTPPAAARPTRRLEETRLQPDSMSAPAAAARAPMPRGAFVLLGSGLVLLIAAVAFALLWKGKKPLSVSIGVDPSGKDRIDILCQECPDGTLISLPDASASISARKAYLTLAEPLPLGENRVTFAVQLPSDPEPRPVELTLPPVEYRIRPNVRTLVGDEPRLTLEIHAIPGSKVEIARQPVALDASGHGEIAVDVGAQLIGPASDVMTFEQPIAYLITPPSGKVYAGELATKIGVTPLILDAPGLDTITSLERFMLAGRTARGAELWVAGTAIAVDAQGRFAQLMSIDSVGETRVTVRATAPGLAPRFVSFRLQRVSSLENEAAVRRRTARPLADVVGNIADHVGSTVVVSGRVEEVRVDGHRSIIVLQSDGRCEGRSCLARLVYGGLRKLARGEVITAIGRLQGAVGAAGADVPEVDVSLLL